MKKGELIAVVGPVACGKTTLLMSILRELEHAGNLHVNERVAFSSQVPWIFNGEVILVIFLCRFRATVEDLRLVISICMKHDNIEFRKMFDEVFGLTETLLVLCTNLPQRTVILDLVPQSQ